MGGGYLIPSVPAEGTGKGLSDSNGAKAPLYIIPLPELHNVISAVSTGSVCGGCCLGFSFHLVKIYFGIFSFHFSSSTRNLSNNCLPCRNPSSFCSYSGCDLAYAGGKRKDFLFAVIFDHYA